MEVGAESVGRVWVLSARARAEAMSKQDGKLGEILGGKRDQLAAAQQYAEDKARRGLVEGFAYFDVWVRILQNETRRAREIAHSKQAPYSKGEIRIDEFLFHVRNLVHVFFAEVEGTSFILRQLALWAARRGEIALTSDERAELQNLDPKTGRQRFPSMIENLELGFRHIGRVFGLSHRLDKGGQGWRDFAGTLQLRHEITHPKRLDDFNPSLDDLRAINGAGVWFYDEVRRLLHEIGSALKSRKKDES